MQPLDYRQAGVNLDLYGEAMRRLPGLLRRTYTPRVLGGVGGFAGLFQLDFAERLFARNYRDPVLIACTDGVGTKLKVAQLCHRHDTVGIDLVAMSVNDALCYGAEPLFFLDYVAMSRDDPPLLEAIVQGISQGCLLADCALIGGETAILPDLYAAGDYDLAGFCVGVAERRNLIDGSTIVPGDVLLGVASSGFHSNGYSLIRKAVFERAGLTVQDYVPELQTTVGELLLRPTRIYTDIVRAVLRHYTTKRVVHGIAHVTGGGLIENVTRILPPSVTLERKPNAWPIPVHFTWLQRLGEISDAEMARVFNMGIGMVLIVSAYYADAIRHMIESQGVPAYVLGQIVPQATAA